MGGTYFCGGRVFVLAMRETSKIGSRVAGCVPFAAVGAVRGRGCGFGDAVVGLWDGPVWDGELVAA
jgi:hypothetical protein